MFFLVLAPDRPGAGEQRLAHRQQHIDYWQKLGDALKLAGPWLAEDKPDGDALGSMLIFEADTLEAARRLAENDPFTIEGVFAADKIRVEPLRPTLGAWKGD